ncbi:MAG: thioredoxin domain-containing protein, partial [Bacteroidota bacterium]
RFICIKVDREERPDIDHVYMSAVQLMTGQGGWPLNCFTLPDKRPLYGGTYFPRHVWNDLLVKLSDFHINDPDKANQYADELTIGMRKADYLPVASTPESFSHEILSECIHIWKSRFDNLEGGPNRTPKFPLPNNYQFLLEYSACTGDKAVHDHVLLTLEKISNGGIYDQLGGGFARYSVDSIWKVPHFEKMLYDNAQLVSLYALAHRYRPDFRYHEVVKETIDFIERELMDASGACYSALDADSEGEEGKYYTWTDTELHEAGLPEFEKIDVDKLFRRYYCIGPKSHWEHGRHILVRDTDDYSIASEFSIDVDSLRSVLRACKQHLLNSRQQRIRPGLDNKVLLSWNAQMIKAWCDAFDTFGELRYLQSAIRCMKWLLEHLTLPEGRVFHSTVIGKKAQGPGFAEDYAFLIQGLISLYRSTFNEQWLHEAIRFTEYAESHHSDHDSGLFWFTSDLDDCLVTRSAERHDNVLPASNSVMAENLFQLSFLADRLYWKERSLRMLAQVVGELPRYGAGFSNWARLLLRLTRPFHEVVICGQSADQLRSQLDRHFLPLVILAGDPDGKSKLPICKERFINDKNLIYVCINNSCQLPVESADAAVAILDKS